jgi:UDP-glucose 4-epimerase
MPTWCSAPRQDAVGYATSKLLDEFLALACAPEHDLRVTVVRLFSTVGPRQSSRYGMVLPNFVRWALAGEPSSIHGGWLPDRSFTWVGDVVGDAGAHQRTARGRPGVQHRNGEEISIRDLALKVREMTDSKSDLVFIFTP